MADFDVQCIRRDFPALHLERDGRPVIYLDNAATSQKPWAVIEATNEYYANPNANVQRGVHRLSEFATERYENARETVARFLGAPLSKEIIFTSGATESINLVAQTYGRQQIGEGDEVLISQMEHHSNIVPWQTLCKEKGARLRIAPINDAGELRMDAFEAALNDRTKLVAVAHVSNALGSLNPLRELIALAHEAGVPVLVDGAQSAPRLPVDVSYLDCDFYACSGHKMCGPTGIGVLYGKAAHLDRMPPWQGGGNMVLSVSFEETVFSELPHKFEAGTPNIAGAIGMGTAVNYLERIGMDAIAAYEQELVAYGTALLGRIEGLRLIGAAREKTGIFLFSMNCAHPHDVGQILDDEGVTVRSGHLCAQPVMERFGVPSATRASMAFYNTKEEIDALARAIQRVKEIFE